VEFRQAGRCHAVSAVERVDGVVGREDCFLSFMLY
jgi:hypothetical protein